jgi:hypothetical protein
LCEPLSVLEPEQARMNDGVRQIGDLRGGSRIRGFDAPVVFHTASEASRTLPVKGRGVHNVTGAPQVSANSSTPSVSPCT